MSNIDDLSKKLRAMDIKGSKTLLLDRDYIHRLLEEIEALRPKSVESDNSNSGLSQRVIHGGKF